MIEPKRGWLAAQARLDRETDPRRRQVLQVLVDHLKAEATVDFDLLLSTLAADAQYKFWVEGSGFGAGPRGLDAVVAHYQNLKETGKDYKSTKYSATLTVLVPKVCPCCGE